MRSDSFGKCNWFLVDASLPSALVVVLVVVWNAPLRSDSVSKLREKFYFTHPTFLESNNLN